MCELTVFLICVRTSPSLANRKADKLADVAIDPSVAGILALTLSAHTVVRLTGKGLISEKEAHGILAGALASIGAQDQANARRALLAIMPELQFVDPLQ